MLCQLKNKLYICIKLKLKIMNKKLTILGLTTLKVKHVHEVKKAVEGALLRAINAKPENEEEFYTLFTRDLYKECLDELSLMEIYCISVIACKITMRFLQTDYADTELTKVPTFLYIMINHSDVPFSMDIFNLLIDLYIVALQGQALVDNTNELKYKTDILQYKTNKMQQEVERMINENKE